MTPLTQADILDTLYGLVCRAPWAATLTGGVYLHGQRPLDSDREDAVVCYIQGDPLQIQTGTLSVLVYVPDIDPFDNGVLTEDAARTAQLQRLVNDWAATLTARAPEGWRYTLRQTVSTEAETSRHQHFVVARLAYQYFI